MPGASRELLAAPERLGALMGVARGGVASLAR